MLFFSYCFRIQNLSFPGNPLLPLKPDLTAMLKDLLLIQWCSVLKFYVRTCNSEGFRSRHWSELRKLTFASAYATTLLLLLASGGTASISLPCQPAPVACSADDSAGTPLLQSTQIPDLLHLASASVKIRNDGMSYSIFYPWCQ